MPTLTLMASPAMKARLEKIAPLLARPHPAPAPPLTRPIGAHPKPILTDPELVAHRARNARRNTLFWQLRQIAPALFATTSPPPMKIGIYTDIAERLGLDAVAQRDLRSILTSHVQRWNYQKALTVEGAVRRDLYGRAAGEVTEEHRAEAAHWLAALKAKRAAAAPEAKGHD